MTTSRQNQIINEFVSELMEKTVQLNALVMEEHYETATLLHDEIKSLIQVTALMLDLDSDIGYENIFKNLDQQYQLLHDKIFNR